MKVEGKWKERKRKWSKETEFGGLQTGTEFIICESRGGSDQKLTH